MKRTGTCAALVLGLVFLIGCNRPPTPTPGKTGKEPAVADAKPAGGHHDWWCDEHGVKEEECSMCNAKVAKAFQAKGDWCNEHRRAKSQCFLCDPTLKDKFAAEYQVKFGKAPPEPDGQKAGN